jgi:5-methylcytosine-specific restriction endonuclease McrA
MTKKTYNNGQWTEARFNSFVKSALRSASQRWPPKYTVLSEACVGQKENPKSGRMAKFYTCNKCKQDYVAKEVEVNHILPVIPVSGFDSWDNVIARLFCEKDELEVLCKPCHKAVTKEENKERKENAKRI